MAITKMMHIKEAHPGGSSSLKRSIAYIMNPKKTEEGILTGSNSGNTSSEIFRVMMDTKEEWGKIDKRQGYHFIISWKPGEVTKEQAYEITDTFCRRYLGDAYDYVYSIHTDKEHLHGHVVFNSVNRIDGHKYRYEKGDWEKYIQPITDQICREYGLPMLQQNKKLVKSMSYAEHKANREGIPTLTKIIRADIDRMIQCADSFEDYLTNMKRLGYRLRIGKYITYYPPGFSKGRRDKTLGSGYSRVEIESRIRAKTERSGLVSSIMSPAVNTGFHKGLRPYMKTKLTPFQITYVRKITLVCRYLDAKDPFAVKWREVRKDALEVNKIFEECMYLLDHHIRDRETLNTCYTKANRREKNLIKRIQERVNHKDQDFNRIIEINKKEEKGKEARKTN